MLLNDPTEALATAYIAVAAVRMVRASIVFLRPADKDELQARVSVIQAQRIVGRAYSYVVTIGMALGTFAGALVWPIGLMRHLADSIESPMSDEEVLAELQFREAWEREKRDREDRGDDRSDDHEPTEAGPSST